MKSKHLFHIKWLMVCSAALLVLTMPGFSATKSGGNTNPAKPGSNVTSTKPTTTVPAASNTLKWSIQPGPPSNLKVLTPNKQLFRLNEVLNLAVLEEGKIVIYQHNPESQWEMLQTIEVPEVVFTTFLVRDLNNDSVPEIIAGTTEPGFIYVYYWDNEQKWQSPNNAKYIWSAITKLTAVKYHETNPATLKTGAAQNSKNSGNPAPYFVVQNKEGFLFVFKFSGDSLDLTWKSPAAWKAIETFVSMDLDNDASEELIVVYRGGGTEILKIVKNAITSKWKGFPWGKVLSMAFNDWDNNNSPELIFTTTQKAVYQIKTNKNAYKSSYLTFDYVIEKLHFLKVQNRKILFAADTSGKVHLLEQPPKSAVWKEVQSFQTGRILEFLELPSGELLLVNQALQTIVIKPE
ncbi:MAG TPA: hypothetical protein VEC37_05505 [Bacillota bacterium]|nr:hypothetical protein [Bacillota bacterium]